MNAQKSNLMLLVLLLAVSCGLGGLSQAMEAPEDWFAQDFASTGLLVQLVTEDETKLLMDGFLRLAYPVGFEIQYFTQTAPVTITSQDGFVQVQRGNDVEYGYDEFWVFQDIQNYLFALRELARLPLKFSGIDVVAERSAHRYVAVDDPQLVLWFDIETGLPLLIRQDNRTLAVIAAYNIVDGVLTVAELELRFTEQTAILTLVKDQGEWVPSYVEIADPPGFVQMEFTNWTYHSEWVDSPLPRLARLSELNDLFLEAYAARNWLQALAISQEMLALAPQFWQVYLYQAFAYEGLDNYLGVIENYQQVLMRQPDNHLALNNLAYHYFLKEVQIPQALEMAERAVALERKDIYLDTLGYGYYLVGRHEEAKELLLEALATAPDDAIPEISGHLELVRKALGEGDQE
ncbi:MAG TPA: hypothetical protein GXZ68_06080 [Firmicutes bacterium]|nr:hypothetical protein [Bacillota bacterium]